MKKDGMFENGLPIPHYLRLTESCNLQPTPLSFGNNIWAPMQLTWPFTHSIKAMKLHFLHKNIYAGEYLYLSA